MSDLEEHAAALGVLTSYVGADGERVRASEGPLEAVVRTVAADRKRASDTRSLPPILVSWDGEPLQLAVSEPVTEVELRLEDGSLGPSPVVHGQSVTLSELPLGYHHLNTVVSGQRESAIVIAAPTRAYSPGDARRSWGLFAPVYAMGEGKLDALSDLIALVARHGGGFAGTLPLLPTFDSDPSPYSPVSRLFWNERLVDVEEDAFDRVEASAHAPDLIAYAQFREGRKGSEHQTGYYVAAQRRAERDLAELASSAAARGVGLYLDLPLGAHRDGFDVAHAPELFASDMDVGAPPDPLFDGGQNWSFPPLLPDRSRRSGHAYFRRAVQHHMRHATLLRIDHVMGLHRLYWIPQGFHARDGVYVSYPEDELYAVVTLESHRSRCVVVGENLGTVPPEVGLRLERHGLLGLFVLEFELESGKPSTNVLASIDTHDTPTFAGFCRAQPEAVQRFDGRLGLESPSDRDRLEAWLRWLLTGEAPYVSIALEDLWLEEDPQNVPGTTTEHANWSRKLRHGLHALPEEVESLLSRLTR